MILMKRISRAFRRCRIQALIDFPQLPRRFDWQVVNLSPDGCQVSGNLNLNLGDRVTCILTLPGCSTDLQVQSLIVWRSGDSYGIRFQEFPPGWKLRLARALYASRNAA
jgi:hypothetical protein